MRRAVHRLPGLHLVDHELRVPLDHAAPDGEQITIFAREVVAARKRDADLPWLLLLEGGPGHASPRPHNRSGWLGRALQDHRVLLLDQRGTGRSTPQTRQTLAGLDPHAQAARLGHFRADAIVRDAELVRRELLGDGTWTVLGQSYGGFASFTYLSLAPEGLSGVIVTGGVPPIGRTADEVYAATYERVLSRQRRFEERYPGDQTVLDAAADRIARGDVQLPSGDPLTVPRLQQLGAVLGAAEGGEVLHYLLETAFAGSDQLSDVFLAGVQEKTSFLLSPMYAVLHESIYCDGPGRASGWAAQRERDKRPELATDVRPLRLTGEMVYPWMFETDAALVPLAAGAQLLAERDDWSPLYDQERLAGNQVPVVAAVYHEDMYVEYAYSAETAAAVGGCRTWVTNEFSHDGLRSDARVLDRLLDMLAGEA